jgi:hypothetical protein
VLLDFGIQIGILLVTLTLVIAIWYSARFASAESLFRQGTSDSVSRAVAMAPQNAAYHARLAEFLEGVGGHPGSELETASRLSPFDSRYLNRLGFLAEVQQDYPAAERVLLRAADVDHGFQPRWALMNYYFRNRSSAPFWHWAELALRRGYGDLTPVFRLCWAQTPDSLPVEKILPNDPEFRLHYLEYLNTEHSPEAAQRVALAVASESTPAADPEAPLTFCSRIMEQNSAAALSVWNVLCMRQVLRCNPLNPEQGGIVTNGDFSANPGISDNPSGRGFDWRLRRVDGVRAEAGNGLSLYLDGRQPEIFEVLEQPLPLASHRRYSIRVEFDATPATSDSGLRWHVDGLHSEVLAEAETMRGAGFRTQLLTFSSGDARLAFLRLTFRRAPGTVRWSGTAVIHRISAQVLP